MYDIEEEEGALDSGKGGEVVIVATAGRWMPES